MDKERILATLREHEPELKAAGLLHLLLFGSVARGDDTAVESAHGPLDRLDGDPA